MKRQAIAMLFAAMSLTACLPPRLKSPLTPIAPPVANASVTQASNFTLEQREVLIQGPSGKGSGPAASARFNQPMGLSAGPNGSLFLADHANDRICVVRAYLNSTDATYVETWVEVTRPTDVVPNFKGGLFIAHAGGLSFYDAQARTMQAIEVVNKPWGSVLSLSRDEVGNVYVSDADRARIFKIDAAMAVTQIAQGDPMVMGQLDSGVSFARPGRVAAGLDGHLYFVDQGRAVRRLTPTGHLSTEAWVHEDDQAPGILQPFVGVAADTQGRVLVANPRDLQIGEYRPDFSATFSIVASRAFTLLNEPHGDLANRLAVGPNGVCYELQPKDGGYALVKYTYRRKAS